MLFLERQIEKANSCFGFLSLRAGVLLIAILSSVEGVLIASQVIYAFVLELYWYTPFYVAPPNSTLGILSLGLFHRVYTIVSGILLFTSILIVSTTGVLGVESGLTKPFKLDSTNLQEVNDDLEEMEDIKKEVNLEMDKDVTISFAGEKTEIKENIVFYNMMEIKNKNSLNLLFLRILYVPLSNIINNLYFVKRFVNLNLNRLYHKYREYLYPVSNVKNSFINQDANYNSVQKNYQRDSTELEPSFKVNRFNNKIEKTNHKLVIRYLSRFNRMNRSVNLSSRELENNYHNQNADWIEKLDKNEYRNSPLKTSITRVSSCSSINSLYATSIYSIGTRSMLKQNLYEIPSYRMINSYNNVLTYPKQVIRVGKCFIERMLKNILSQNLKLRDSINDNKKQVSLVDYRDKVFVADGTYECCSSHPVNRTLEVLNLSRIHRKARYTRSRISINAELSSSSYKPLVCADSPYGILRTGNSSNIRATSQSLYPSTKPEHKSTLENRGNLGRPSKEILRLYWMPSVIPGEYVANNPNPQLIGIATAQIGDSRYGNNPSMDGRSYNTNFNNQIVTTNKVEHPLNFDAEESAVSPYTTTSSRMMRPHYNRYNQVTPNLYSTYYNSDHMRPQSLGRSYDKQVTFQNSGPRRASSLKSLAPQPLVFDMKILKSHDYDEKKKKFPPVPKAKPLPKTHRTRADIEREKQKYGPIIYGGIEKTKPLVSKSINDKTSKSPNDRISVKRKGDRNHRSSKRSKSRSRSQDSKILGICPFRSQSKKKSKSSQPHHIRGSGRYVEGQYRDSESNPEHFKYKELGSDGLLSLKENNRSFDMQNKARIPKKKLINITKDQPRLSIDHRSEMKPIDGNISMPTELISRWQNKNNTKGSSNSISTQKRESVNKTLKKKKSVDKNYSSKKRVSDLSDTDLRRNSYSRKSLKAIGASSAQVLRLSNGNISMPTEMFSKNPKDKRKNSDIKSIKKVSTSSSVGQDVNKVGEKPVNVRRSSISRTFIDRSHKQNINSDIKLSEDIVDGSLNTDLIIKQNLLSLSEKSISFDSTKLCYNKSNPQINNGKKTSEVHSIYTVEGFSNDNITTPSQVSNSLNNGNQALCSIGITLADKKVSCLKPNLTTFKTDASIPETYKNVKNDYKYSNTAHCDSTRLNKKNSDISRFPFLNQDNQIPMNTYKSSKDLSKQNVIGKPSSRPSSQISLNKSNNLAKPTIIEGDFGIIGDELIKRSFYLKIMHISMIVTLVVKIIHFLTFSPSICAYAINPATMPQYLPNDICNRIGIISAITMSITVFSYAYYLYIIKSLYRNYINRQPCPKPSFSIWPIYTKT